MKAFLMALCAALLLSIYGTKVDGIDTQSANKQSNLPQIFELGSFNENAYEGNFNGQEFVLPFPSDYYNYSDLPTPDDESAQKGGAYAIKFFNIEKKLLTKDGQLSVNIHVESDNMISHEKTQNIHSWINSLITGDKKIKNIFTYLDENPGAQGSKMILYPQKEPFLKDVSLSFEVKNEKDVSRLSDDDDFQFAQTGVFSRNKIKKLLDRYFHYSFPIKNLENEKLQVSFELAIHNPDSVTNSSNNSKYFTLRIVKSNSLVQKFDTDLLPPLIKEDATGKYFGYLDHDKDTHEITSKMIRTFSVGKNHYFLEAVIEGGVPGEEEAIKQTSLEFIEGFHVKSNATQNNNSKHKNN